MPWYRQVGGGVIGVLWQNCNRQSGRGVGSCSHNRNKNCLAVMQGDEMWWKCSLPEVDVQNCLRTFASSSTAWIALIGRSMVGSSTWFPPCSVAGMEGMPFEFRLVLVVVSHAGLCRVDLENSRRIQEDFICNWLAERRVCRCWAPIINQVHMPLCC